MIKRKTPLKSKPLKSSFLASTGLKSGGLRQTSIKSSKSPSAGRKTPKNQKEEDIAFYTRVWDKRPHQCQVCGEPLGPEPHWIWFEHLLEKSPYPELRHEEENIALVCWDCHTVKSNGHPRPKHQELIDNAKKRFLCPKT